MFPVVCDLNSVRNSEDSCGNQNALYCNETDAINACKGLCQCYEPVFVCWSFEAVSVCLLHELLDMWYNTPMWQLIVKQN